MSETYKTVAGKLVDHVMIAKTLSVKSPRVTLGDLEITLKGDAAGDMFTRDKFEGALKKVNRRQKAKTPSS